MKRVSQERSLLAYPASVYKKSSEKTRAHQECHNNSKYCLQYTLFNLILAQGLLVIKYIEVERRGPEIYEYDTKALSFSNL